MITKEEIKKQLSKAKYKLALNTVSYWMKVSFGNKCEADFKKLVLMRYYINILEAYLVKYNYENCTCKECLDEYTIDFTSFLDEQNLGKIQFFDNEFGAVSLNGNLYQFSYNYNEESSELLINFLDVELQWSFPFTFNNECSLIPSIDILSPVSYAEVNPENEPVTLPGYDSFMYIKLSSDDSIVYEIAFPSSFSPEEIVDLWNTTHGTTGFYLTYNNGYRMISPIGDYGLNYYFEYSQPEGGTESFTQFISPFVPFVTTPTPATTIQSYPTNIFTGVTGEGLRIEILDGITGVKLLEVTNTELYFTDLAGFIDYFNENNILGYTVAVDSVSGPDTNLIYTAPQGLGASINNIELQFTFTADPFPTTSIFTGGIDTTQGSLTIGLYQPDNTFVQFLYLDEEVVNYSSEEDIVNAFNNSPTNLGFVMSFDGTNFRITAPEDTFADYDGYYVEFTYLYFSDEYTDIQEQYTFGDGEYPVLVNYTDFFNPNTGEIEEFVKPPCIPKESTLDCLNEETAELFYNKLKDLC